MSDFDDFNLDDHFEKLKKPCSRCGARELFLTNNLCIKCSDDDHKKRMQEIQRRIDQLGIGRSANKLSRPAQPTPTPKQERQLHYHCVRPGCFTKLRSPNYYGVCSYCQAKMGMYRR